MSISCGPLTLDRDGTVYLNLGSEDDTPECLGHIDDGDPAPEYEVYWFYLQDIHHDGQRAAAGYEAAVDAAWFARQPRLV